MVKVSITLPNNAQITFESEEPEVIHEVVGMVLRDLPRELMQSTVQANGNGEHQTEAASSNGAAGAKAEDAVPSLMPSDDLEVLEQRLEEQPPVSSGKNLGGHQPTSLEHQDVRRELTPAERDFVQFCQQANPLGDMRRVVVAAEGAARYLDAESVDPNELGRLFDLVGWQRPHSFVQTLRNAARSKFRWLERVPGRSGHYTVTPVGRTTTFGS